MLDFRGIQGLVADEGVESAGGGDNNVRAFVLVTERLLVLDHRGAAIESTDTDVGHVLGETSVLVLDLVGQLTGVAQNNDRHLAVHRLQLLERRQDKHRRLSVTRLCLAQDVHSKDSLWDALLLDCMIHQVNG